MSGNNRRFPPLTRTLEHSSDHRAGPSSSSSDPRRDIQLATSSGAHGSTASDSQAQRAPYDDIQSPSSSLLDERTSASHLSLQGNSASSTEIHNTAWSAGLPSSSSPHIPIVSLRGANDQRRGLFNPGQWGSTILPSLVAPTSPSRTGVPGGRTLPPIDYLAREVHREDWRHPPSSQRTSNPWSLDMTHQDNAALLSPLSRRTEWEGRYFQPNAGERSERQAYAHETHLSTTNPSRLHPYTGGEWTGGGVSGSAYPTGHQVWLPSNRDELAKNDGRPHSLSVSTSGSGSPRLPGVSHRPSTLISPQQAGSHPSMMPSGIVAASHQSGPSRQRRPPKTHVPSACVNCKKTHLACDVERPCGRCVLTGKADSCVDARHKKRGRPRLRDRVVGGESSRMADGEPHQEVSASISAGHTSVPGQQSASTAPPGGNNKPRSPGRIWD